MRTILLITAILFMPTAAAEEFTRSSFPSSASGNHNGVVGIAAISSSRPDFPATQDSIRVYVESAAWGVSSCRADAFDIPRTEDHMLSVALTTDLRVVVVDDALPMIDSVCQAVVVRGAPNQVKNHRNDTRNTPP